MKAIYYITWFFGVFFLVIENLRRGIGYYAINASTMIEDTIMGLLFIGAVLVYRKKEVLGEKLLMSAWAFGVGGMLLPFMAHFEAFLRGATFRPDHPHEDVNSIILKAVIWGICVTMFVLTVKKSGSSQSESK